MACATFIFWATILSTTLLVQTSQPRGQSKVSVSLYSGLPQLSEAASRRDTSPPSNNPNKLPKPSNSASSCGCLNNFPVEWPDFMNSCCCGDDDEEETTQTPVRVAQSGDAPAQDPAPAPAQDNQSGTPGQDNQDHLDNNRERYSEDFTDDTQTQVAAIAVEQEDDSSFYYLPQFYSGSKLSNFFRGTPPCDSCSDNDCFQVDPPWNPEPDPWLPSPDPNKPEPDPWVPNPNPHPDPMRPGVDPMMPCPNPCGPCGRGGRSKRQNSPTSDPTPSPNTPEKITLNIPLSPEQETTEQTTSERQQRDLTPLISVHTEQNFTEDVPPTPRGVSISSETTFGDIPNQTRQKRQTIGNTEYNIRLANDSESYTTIFVDGVPVQVRKKRQAEEESNLNSTTPEPEQETSTTTASSSVTSAPEVTTTEDPNLKVISLHETQPERLFYSRRKPSVLDGIIARTELVEERMRKNHYYRQPDPVPFVYEPRFYSSAIFFKFLDALFNLPVTTEPPVETKPKNYFEPIIKPYFEVLNQVFDDNSLLKFGKFLENYSRHIVEAAVQSIMFSKQSNFKSIVQKCVSTKSCLIIDSNEIQNKISEAFTNIARLFQDVIKKSTRISPCNNNNVCMHKNIYNLRKLISNTESISNTIFYNMVETINNLDCKPQCSKLLVYELEKIIQYFNQHVSQYPLKKIL